MAQNTTPRPTAATAFPSVRTWNFWVVTHEGLHGKFDVVVRITTRLNRGDALFTSICHTPLLDQNQKSTFQGHS